MYGHIDYIPSYPSLLSLIEYYHIQSFLSRGYFKIILEGLKSGDSAKLNL